MKKKLFIFSNESIYLEDNKFYCENLDLKSTPEGLNKKFEVNLFGRKSSRKRSHEIKIKKIKIFNNIFSYISSVIAASKNEEAKFLIISISPYTFIISLFIKLLGRKPILYLRSDGFGEYKAILGKIGPIIYHVMFSITGAISNIISCRDYILRGKKGKIISPSQLDSTWLKKPKNLDIKNIFILPSFTEGHPMVLLEALARRRPVVIFNEIKHAIGEKKGIFVSRRNFISFFGTLNNIKKNYKKIQKDMKKNKLPINKEFIDKFVKLIDDFK